MSGCSCKLCVSCCKNTPGWFAPGEAEKAAKLLLMDFAAFKKKFLIVDYWIGVEDGEKDIFVLSPRKVGVDENRTIASWGFPLAPAPCIFLVNDLCRIHEAKPKECRETFGCKERIEKQRKAIAELWKDDPLNSEGSS